MPGARDPWTSEGVGAWIYRRVWWVAFALLLLILVGGVIAAVR